MRTSQLVTSYIQAVIFLALGIRCVNTWVRERDTRSGHLAIAAGLFGLQSGISAVRSTIYDSTAIPPETPPHWIGVVTSIMLFIAVYFFLLFLLDFITLPRKANVGGQAFLIIATAFNIVMSIIERPDIRFDPRRGLVDVPGVNNPISYRGYLIYVLTYLAVAFGFLAVAFLVYGFRTSGLARFRMISIGSGFFLFFIVIGLLPRLLFGNPSAQTVRNLITVLQYVALLVAPLLFIGFSPPRFIRDRFRGAEVGSAAGV